MAGFQMSAWVTLFHVIGSSLLILENHRKVPLNIREHLLILGLSHPLGCRTRDSKGRNSHIVMG